MSHMPVRELGAADFPELLKEIPDPPKTLYLRGTLPSYETHRFLAVVGSRKYTSYGKDACESLIQGLAGTPTAIVSGLALGIDGFAHRAALSAGLPTVAVPGSGLSEEALYPAAHRELGKKILEAGGALLSEFPPEFRARPESFPQRNRIMAGMSHAVLVIEAAERSGTLITSRLATEYNREVLAVPGSIFSESSKGPHLLIRLGATPVRSSEDILEALGLERTETSEALHDPALSEAERRVLELIAEPKTRDELIEMLGLSASEANILLSTMELKGRIVERMGTVRRAS